MQAVATVVVTAMLLVAVAAELVALSPMDPATIADAIASLSDWLSLVFMFFSFC